MSPLKPIVSSPVLVSLESSATSIVHGCPGVPRSIPRIETTIQIRSISGSPFNIRNVGITLTTTQKISIPGKFGSNDAFKTFKLFENPICYRPPIGQFYQKLIALDIPVFIPLPRDIESSGYIPGYNGSTVHKLNVKVSLGDSVENEVNFLESFPVVIKCYDTLPLYRQFNEPVVSEAMTSDKQVLVECKLPVSSVGPGDDINLQCKLTTNTGNNRLHKHIQLKQLTLQLKEIIECFDSGLPPERSTKLVSTSQIFDKQEITPQPFIYEFNIKFPFENEYLSLFSQPQVSLEPELEQDCSTTVIESYNISKIKQLEKLEDGIPITHIQGFTNSGKFFAIRYELILKVKLTHAKDIHVNIPITISPYDRTSSEYILQWIIYECEVAKNKYGKRIIEDVCQLGDRYKDVIGLMSRFVAAPIYYRYSIDEWKQLGYNIDAIGVTNGIAKANSLIGYID
ncbi:Uncharacterized protein JA1_004448 [Spathaspora sp. JA1]|nr:Uncharacterized protein JA1_004448 [Spathaspora sp. JA1]